jgi:hypothetical protein
MLHHLLPGLEPVIREAPHRQDHGRRAIEDVLQPFPPHPRGLRAQVALIELEAIEGHEHGRGGHAVFGRGRIH